MPRRRPRQKTETRWKWFEDEDHEEADDPRFDCRVQCAQCDSWTKKGTRCKRRCCFTLPKCPAHARQAWGVEVSKSTIPGAGKGLFVTEDKTRRTWLCPVDGAHIDLKETLKRMVRIMKWNLVGHMFWKQRTTHI